MSYDDALPLPFDPVALGWPNLPRDFEYRPLLDWSTEYAWPKPCMCTICRRHGDDSVKARCVLWKYPHARFPLGYLDTRCPDHPYKGNR